MKDCAFCKIVSGELPSMKIYEDEWTLAFMDLAKDVDGHILVIPKKHCKCILDCDAETLGHVMNAVRRVSEHLVGSCGYEGVNILNAGGEAAGQSVPHFHIHIIPRHHDDGLGVQGAWPDFPGAKHDIEEMHRKLMMK